VSTTQRGVAESGWSRPLAITIAGAFFLEIFDGTVLVTAAPRIAGDFGVSPDAVGIAVTAYLCAVAAMIPLSGWLARRFGSRRTFLFAVVLFALASVCCAASPALWVLAGARVLQGIAGSMMVPVGNLIVLGNAAKHQLVRAVAYLTWPALAAPVVAPFVGGLITDTIGWHWIFLVNVPIAAALFVASWFVVPRDAPQEPPRLDVLGFAVAAIGIIALVLGLQWVVDPPLWPVGAGLLVVAVGSAALTIVRGRRVPGAILDFRAYRFPTYRLTNGSGTIYRAGVLSAPFLVPLLFQSGFGWSAVDAGAMLIWLFLGNLGIKPLTTPILKAIGFRWMIASATVVVAASFVAIALLPRTAPIALTAVVLLVSGVARSVGFTGYVTIQFADVPKELMNGANTVATTFNQLSQGLGVAVAAAAVAVAGLVEAAGTEAAVRTAFIAMAVLLLASLAGVLALPRNAAAHLTARPADT